MSAKTKRSQMMTKDDKKAHKEFREMRRKGRGKAWLF